jgi:hypothetical protein
MDPNVLQTIILLAVAAFLGAGFGVGADFIKQYIKSGKVTPEHAKKEDLDKLEKAFKESFIKLEGAFHGHLDKHNECEKNFVNKEFCERHIIECPIKDAVVDIKAQSGYMNQHEVRHGKFETMMDQRLSVIEEFAKETNLTFKQYSKEMNELNTNLRVMVEQVKTYHKENGNGKK